MNLFDLIISPDMVLLITALVLIFSIMLWVIYVDHQ